MRNVKKTLSMFLAASLVLGACGKVPQTSEQGSASVGETTQEAAAETSESKDAAGETQSTDETNAAGQEAGIIDTSVMKPWINSNIMGVVTDDVTADIKDDYYLNVNHDYLRDATLRPGRSAEFPLLDAADNVKDRCNEILTDKTLEGRDADLTKGYYELFLDWDKRNEVGVTPLIPYFEKLKGLSDIEELNELLLSDECNRYGGTLANLTLGTYAEDSSLYTIVIGSTPLCLLDPAEYKELTENGNRVKKYREDTCCYMLGRLGYSEEESKKIFEGMIRFETKIASYMKTYLEWNDASAVKESINMVTMDDIKEMSPNYPLAQYMEKYGYGKSKLININEPKWLEGLNEIYNDENFEDIKSYLIANNASAYITFVDEEAFRTYQKCTMEYSGIQQASADEDIAYGNVMTRFSDNISRIYIEKYLSPEIKEEITELCKESIDTYKDMLDDIEWLSDTTKENAKYKLDHMTIHAVYPDKWEDDSMYSITTKENGGDYLNATLDIVQADQKKVLSHINGKVDKEIWGINILDTNAYYNRLNNSINIIPGFFCDTSYRSDMTKEEKYGALGSVIGHEISHAFDTSGAQYDAEGNLKDWWTEEDYAAFSERADKLIKYYDNVVAFDDGTPYQGQIVQTEAIADMAGLKCMLLMAQKVDGFDYDKFFRAHAYMWAKVETLESMEGMVLSDSHPLNYLRCNVSLQQFDEFFETYDIKEGDGMYIAPEDRIAVW